MKRKKTKKPRQRQRTKRRAVSADLHRPIFAAFFLSGFAGLMHQVVWAKLLEQLIGATAYAQVVVLAVFMGGLALGAVLFGRRSDRSRRPLRTYVVLELMIGGYCLALPLLMYLAGLGYVGLATQFFEFAGIALLLRFTLVTLVILFPAVLMGATLPILARYLIGKVEDTQRQVASLYALNSFGAVLGAGFAGFVMLPWLGIYASLVVASLLNFAAGAVVLHRARREGSVLAKADTKSPARASSQGKQATEFAPSYRPVQYAVTLFALFSSGFAAMGYEVLFTRIIALSFGSSTYSFSVMLMSFITGIGIGSAIVSRIRVRRPLWLLSMSQFAVVASLLIATPLISRMPYLIGLLRIELQDAQLGFELYQIGKALLCLAVLLVPTICLGVSFPLVARIQARNSHEIGQRVGSTYAWNTVGNVLGAVGTSLVLLPLLGLRDAFHFNLALNFFAGSALLLVAAEAGIPRRLLASAATASVVVIVYLSVGMHWSDGVNLAANHLRLRAGPAASLDAEARKRHPSSSFEAWKRTYLVPREKLKHFFFAEDSHATVLVAGTDKNMQLYVNSKPDASTANDLDTQLLIAHAPLFLAPEARTVLIIGHGSGISAGSVMRHPIEHADLVEISPSVIRADAMFTDHNYHVLSDPRARMFVDDGQTFLRTSPRRYDIIISQPPNPWIAGVGGLFTVEYFENVRGRLNPGGLFTFWFHTYEQSDEAVKLIVRTVGSVFPNIMLFADNDLGNLVAVASMEPIEPDFASMERRYSDPAIRDDLARLGMTNLTSLLSHHRVSQQQFPSLVTPGPLNTVGHQRLEYMSPRSFFHHDNSFFLDQFDPLIKGTSTPSDVLLDRYIAYREDAGRPITHRELADAARYAAGMGGYGRKVAEAIGGRGRAEWGGSPRSMTKRDPSVP